MTKEEKKLRDMFAGQALKSLLMCDKRRWFWNAIECRKLARRCYRIANHMMIDRAKSSF